MTDVCEKRDGGERIGGEAADSLSPMPSTRKGVIPNAVRNLFPNHYNLFIFHSLFFISMFYLLFLIDFNSNTGMKGNLIFGSLHPAKTLQLVTLPLI